MRVYFIEVIRSGFCQMFAFFIFCNFFRKILHGIKKILKKKCCRVKTPNPRCACIANALSLIRENIAGESRQLTETRSEMRERC